jgi:hypothetical protein
MLPTLPDSLRRSDPPRLTARYVFEGVENASSLGKSTFVALIPDGEGMTQVELTVSSYGKGSRAATETLTIDGFTFYELKTPVEFGQLVVKHLAPSDDDGPEPRLFAVALIGDREAGSPRVEIPRMEFATAIE